MQNTENQLINKLIKINFNLSFKQKVLGTNELLSVEKAKTQGT